MKATIYCPVQNAALRQALGILESQGFHLLPAPGTSVTHLLLPVPSFTTDGKIKGGGDLETVLSALPENVTVIGGNLTHPALKSYKVIDLLQDAFYVTENANITAHCAVQLLSTLLPCTLQGVPVLVIGWGRIGKCLARLLRLNGACVTVYARKKTDRALLSALGYQVQATPAPDSFRVVINTAPAMVLPHCPENILKIELSSVMGIGGEGVILARGLPSAYAPESSGNLIGDTIARLLTHKEGTQ